MQLLGERLDESNVLDSSNPSSNRWFNSQMFVSRASAAALSTVLRPILVSYGNMRFSGICPAETPQPIKIKFCMIDYVGEFTRCAKNG